MKKCTFWTKVMTSLAIRETATKNLCVFWFSTSDSTRKIAFGKCPLLFI